MTEEQFDNIIRSTMESGTEEVPAGMWEAICGKLAPAGVTKAKGGFRWWKRVAAGLALACIAAAIVFVSLPHTDVSSEDTIVAEAVIKHYDAQAAEPSGNETPGRQAIVERIAENKVTVPRKVETEFVAARNDDTGDDFDLEDAAGNEEAVDNDKAVDETPEGSAYNKTIDIYDPVFTMPDRKKDKLSHFALSVNANAGQNSGTRSMGEVRMSTVKMDFGSAGSITETEATSYLIPITAGITLRYNFNEHWAIGAGVNYTYLNRHFRGVYDYGGVENHQCDNILNNQHFIGIPVNAYYNFITSGRLRFYVYLGGTVEKCIYNNYSFDYYRSHIDLKQNVAGVQLSADAGLGLQVNVTDWMGIYIDPSFRYYFRNYLQPKSIRTEEPMQIGAEIGIRFDL